MPDLGPGGAAPAFEAYFSARYESLSLDVFRDLPAELWSEGYFRANELSSLYVDLHVASVLERLGAPPPAAGRAGSLEPCPAGVIPELNSSWRWLASRAADAPLLAWGEEGAACRERLRASILAESPGIASFLDLVDLASQSFPAFLRGERQGDKVLFDARALPLWERFFANENALYGPVNALAAHAAARAVSGSAAPRASSGRSGMRVLEVGAGLGSGSECLVRRLGERLESYVLTDISPNFLRKARERVLGALEGKAIDLVCLPLDLNQTPAGWRQEAASFDLVYAVNVLHTVRDLVAVLRGLRELVRPGGALVLGECLRTARGRPMYPEFVFQLLDEFRAARLDPGCRPDWGFLDAEGWRAALARAGLPAVMFLPDFEAALAAYPRHFVEAIVARRAEGQS